MRFQSKDIQSFISYNVWPFFVLSGCEYAKYNDMLICAKQIANTIENESKNRVCKQNGYRGENVKRENEI